MPKAGPHLLPLVLPEILHESLEDHVLHRLICHGSMDP